MPPGFVRPVNSNNIQFNSAYSQMEFDPSPMAILGSNLHNTYCNSSDRQAIQGFSAKKSDHPSRLFKKVSSKRGAQLTSIDSTLTTVSSLDVTQGEVF